jgi:hypothetical protein
MTADVSWSRSAQRYAQLYLSAMAARREGLGLITAQGSSAIERV